MKPIKNFHKLCEALSVFTLNGEHCKFQMYDTTEFWLEPVRKDWENAKIYPVLFRPDWENETMTIRVCEPNTIYKPIHSWIDVVVDININARQTPQNWVEWIWNLISKYRNNIYR